MFEEKDVFEITDSEENFETWSQKDFLSDDVKEMIRQSDILIVPTLKFRDIDGPSFPPDTEDILMYLKQHINDQITVEICADENTFNVLALHSDYKRLGKFVVKDVALPLFLSVFGGYILSKVTAPQEAKTQINIINNISTPTTAPKLDTLKLHEEKSHKKRRPHKFMEPSKVTFTVTVVDTTGKSKSYHYEGPAKDVKMVTEEIKKDFINEP